MPNGCLIIVTARSSTSRAPAMSSPPAPRHLVVAGDILIDHHLYAGERASPATRDRRGVRETKEHGGADLLRRSLDALFAADAARGVGAAGWVTHLGAEPPALSAAPTGSDGYAVWEPYELARHGTDTAQVWRASRLMGYGHLATGEEDGLKPSLALSLPDPDLLVLDDAGFLCRHAKEDPAWALAERVPSDGLILLKMSEPVAQGELWHLLSNSFADRLICLVAARDLRRERLALDRGLSWEATLDDLRVALHTHPAARLLLKCRHLIVTFSADGAFWLDRTKDAAPRAHVCLDTSLAEGDWAARFEGEAVGYHCAMTASLGLALAGYTDARRKNKTADKPEPEPDLDLLPAIEAGLLAMRDLKQYGHGIVGHTLPTGYPTERIVAKILDARDGKLQPKERLARIEIEWPGDAINTRPGWSIVEASQRVLGSTDRGPLLGLAWQLAQRGTVVLERLPSARFGKLMTADRAEIETLRYIRQQMQLYAGNPEPKRPLSIGVFGPPGSGKSFGVKQLANEVFGDDACREFNLSQFRDPTDLNGAFHQVRDQALAGLTPVVFWDEFDSRRLFWLQYLLAPMQDGRFQDGQLNHRLGKCVFVFAGGTSWSFAEFPTSQPEDRFRLRKGPDFISRLDAYIDVLGPNPRSRPNLSGEARQADPDDIGYPLRRAILIRAYLGCGPGDRVDFDPDLLNALLRVKHYRQGARSLEKLIEILRNDDNRLTLRRSNLPRTAQLAIHVDVEEFMQLMLGKAGNVTALDDAAVEKIAAAIHETYRALSKEEGWSMQPHFDKPYAELAEIDKEDNRAAARRMPEALALIGLGLRGQSEGEEAALPPEELKALLDQNIDRTAEAEHDGWMEHRARNGWRYGKTRDEPHKLTPAMVPYAQLPEQEKGKDRNSVRHYPDFAARADYRIVRLG
jgi:hypothetical protein